MSIRNKFNFDLKLALFFVGCAGCWYAGPVYAQTLTIPQPAASQEEADTLNKPTGAQPAPTGAVEASPGPAPAPAVAPEPSAPPAVVGADAAPRKSLIGELQNAVFFAITESGKLKSELEKIKQRVESISVDIDPGAVDKLAERVGGLERSVAERPVPSIQPNGDNNAAGQPPANASAVDKLADRVAALERSFKDSVAAGGKDNPTAPPAATTQGIRILVDRINDLERAVFKDSNASELETAVQDLEGSLTKVNGDLMALRDRLEVIEVNAIDYNFVEDAGHSVLTRAKDAQADYLDRMRPSSECDEIGAWMVENQVDFEKQAFFLKVNERVVICRILRTGRWRTYRASPQDTGHLPLAK